MRNRSELAAQLAKSRHDRAVARVNAATMWRDHPVRRHLRAKLDLLADEAVDDQAPRVANLLAGDNSIPMLMADMATALGREPFFDPPCPPISDDIHCGIVILDHPVALLTLSVASADAIMARKSAGGGAGSVGISGSVSVMKLHRAGGAMLRFWNAEGRMCRPEARSHRCHDGDVFVIDGRSRGYVVESCASDLVMLRATLRAGQAPVRREYDAQSRALVGVASNDEAASRSQMLLTLLRIAHCREAASCFADALAGEPHYLRWHAMREYLALDTAAAWPLLERMAASDPHAEVRQAARRTLEAIAARNPEHGGVVPCRA